LQQKLTELQSLGVAAAALAVAAADVTEDVGCLDETGLATLKGFRKLLRKEKANLLQQRLSVREMASQFEREQAAAHAAAATLAHVQVTHMSNFFFTHEFCSQESPTASSIARVGDCGARCKLIVD
jgi:hypothetical protein